MPTLFRISNPAPAIALTLSLACHGIAAGQTTDRAIFVANNGNLEGSITSFFVNEDGTLSFADRLVTGERDSLQEPCPGCNASTISITPDGQYLAVGHPASNDASQAISIIEVGRNAELTLVEQFFAPSSLLGVVWIDDRILAATQSAGFATTNTVNIFRFQPSGPSLTLQDSTTTTGFTTDLAVDRERRRLFAQQTIANGVRSYSVAMNGSLTELDFLPLDNTYQLGLGASADGTRLYAGGGISNGGNKVSGVAVDPETGALSPIPGQPFDSGGSAPKQAVVSDDGLFVIAGHGSDATVRTFFADEQGALTATGVSFDVGSQGTLGRVATMDEFVFATDTSTLGNGLMGVYSFTLGQSGELQQNGPLYDTEGLAPNGIAVWNPVGAPCPGDLTGDGDVKVFDLLELLDAWGACADPGDCPADLDRSGTVDVFDLLLLLENWGGC